MDDAANEHVAQGHWECPHCRALVPATYTLAAARASRTIDMYCGRCDTAWPLSADARSRLLTYLEQRAAR